MSHAAGRREARAADGALIEYEVTGQGPPLLMLHGVLASRTTFARNVPALAEKFRLILPSFRGHDGSDAVLPENYGAAASDVDDIRAVLAAEAVVSCHVLGHSSGGATAFALACSYPALVRRLVLIEPTLLCLLPSAERALFQPSFTAIADAAARHGAEAGLREAMAFLGGDGWHRLEPERQAARLASMAGPARVLGPHMRALTQLPMAESDLRGLAAPALLFYGADSYAVEPPIARRFAVLRPDLPVRTLDGAGHNVHRDRPDIVNAEVLAFLAE